MLFLFLFLFKIYSSRRTNKIDDVFSNKRCANWFKEYSTLDDPETLGPDAMERFCKDIGVDPEDVVMLGMLNHCIIELYSANL